MLLLLLLLLAGALPILLLLFFLPCFRYPLLQLPVACTQPSFMPQHPCCWQQQHKQCAGHQVLQAGGAGWGYAVVDGVHPHSSGEDEQPLQQRGGQHECRPSEVDILPNHWPVAQRGQFKEAGGDEAHTGGSACGVLCVLLATISGHGPAVAGWGRAAECTALAGTQAAAEG
ncbi:hypothetical protein COO60DRAFT_1492338 [Scenedesmus sp. NREL 46B-D3]|nr:hypothetical protein COO60DRAFT_1492338 [Scenedesmus sp. NREL 46B-D3]